MNEKKEFNFLDEVEEEQKGRGVGLKILLVVAISLSGVLFTLWWGKVKGGTKVDSHVEGKDFQAIETTTQYAGVIDFAERFTIMAFNVSYTDIDHQTDKVSGLMVDNLMSLYSEAFLDPKWVEFLRSSKAYVVYQRIDRSSVINSDGSHYWVRVIGKCVFNSDNTPSQLELPMNLIVVVKNDNGSMQISNFQEF